MLYYREKYEDKNVESVVNGVKKFIKECKNKNKNKDILMELKPLKDLNYNGPYIITRLLEPNSNFTKKEIKPARDPHITTCSGIQWNLFNPATKDVKINDIAASLSKLCRFNGHVKHFYSVAQHSVLVAANVRASKKFNISWDTIAYAFTHDFSESYLGDVIRPLKYGLCSNEYRDLESKTEDVILKAFNINPTKQDRKIVKYYDNSLLLTEKRDLTNFSDHEWEVDGEILSTKITPLNPEAAEKQFMDMFNMIMSEKSNQYAPK